MSGKSDGDVDEMWDSDIRGGSNLDPDVRGDSIGNPDVRRTLV